MQILKYAVVGGTAAVVDVSLFVVFAQILEFPYLLVGFITFLLATLVNYLLSIKFVFQSGVKHSKKKEVILIYLVSAIGISLNLLILFLSHEFLHFQLFISKIIATGGVFLWNYYIRKQYIFA